MRVAVDDLQQTFVLFVRLERHFRGADRLEAGGECFVNRVERLLAELTVGVAVERGRDRDVIAVAQKLLECALHFVPDAIGPANRLLCFIVVADLIGQLALARTPLELAVVDEPLLPISDDLHQFDRAIDGA